MSQHQAVDALLASSNSSISFRHLSTHFHISTRAAQSLLLSYVSTRPTLQTLWCVTTLSSTSHHRRISLTTTPPKHHLSKTIWAVAPPAITPLWLASDAAAALKLSAAPPTQPNSLRDGRFNPIRSERSLWKPSTELQLGQADKISARADREKKGGLLAEVKAKVRARDAKRATARSAFKPLVNGANADGGAVKAGLFSSKSLGANAAAKIRAAEREKETETEMEMEGVEQRNGGAKRGELEGKKGKRVVEVGSDEEEASEGEREREALERESAEKERADREREELRKEVEDLTRQHEGEDEEPQSPEIRDLDEETVEREVDMKKKMPVSKSPEKRKLQEAFGLPEVSQPRRIRREVEETVLEEDGYLHTRRIVKVTNEHGNEVIEDSSDKEAEQNDKKNGDVKAQTKGTFSTPLKPTNSQGGKTMTSARKEKAKDGKKPASKQGSSTPKRTPKKKIKGNIMSYFGKKS